MYKDFVSDESPYYIRVNECETDHHSLVTQRFRKLFNELEQARNAALEEAAKAVDSMECAQCETYVPHIAAAIRALKSISTPAASTSAGTPPGTASD